MVAGECLDQAGSDMTTNEMQSVRLHALSGPREQVESPASAVGRDDLRLRVGSEGPDQVEEDRPEGGAAIASPTSVRTQAVVTTGPLKLPASATARAWACRPG